MIEYKVGQSNSDSISTSKQSDVITKEKLKELLKTYKKILNKSMIDYLNSLIELEFSIIKENISNDEREKLSELEIYKETANYNITKRALNIIDNKNNEIDIIIKQDEDNLCIYGNIDRNSILLFGYDYIGSENNDKVDVGKISLYRTINSVEQIEKEKNRISSILKTLEKEKNPHKYVSNVFVGPAVTWLEKHNNQIKMYEDKLTKLQEKTELTENDIREIEITNMIHELILEDYGLTNDDFIINQAFRKNTIEKTELYKSYIKQVPKINIKSSIKYI